MIAGTLILEDNTLQFSVQFDNKVIYTVADNSTGEAETKKVSAQKFMLALGLALSFDGDFPVNISDAWKAAESCQPDNKNLRFIP